MEDIFSVIASGEFDDLFSQSEVFDTKVLDEPPNKDLNRERSVGSDVGDSVVPGKVPGSNRPLRAICFTVDNDISSPLLNNFEGLHNLSIGKSKCVAGGYVKENYKDGRIHYHGFFKFGPVAVRQKAFLVAAEKVCGERFWAGVNWKPETKLPSKHGNVGVDGWQEYCLKVSENVWIKSFGKVMLEAPGLAARKKYELARDNLGIAAVQGNVSLVLDSVQLCPRFAVSGSLKNAIFAANLFSKPRTQLGLPHCVFLFGSGGSGKTSFAYDMVQCSKISSNSCFPACFPESPSTFLEGVSSTPGTVCIWNDIPTHPSTKLFCQINDTYANRVNVKGGSLYANMSGNIFTSVTGPKSFYDSKEDFFQVFRRLCVVIKLEKAVYEAQESRYRYATKSELCAEFDLDKSMEIIKDWRAVCFYNVPDECYSESYVSVSYKPGTYAHGYDLVVYVDRRDHPSFGSFADLFKYFFPI